jgi:hypothetical protein
MRIVGANGDVICDVDPFDVLPEAQANLRLIAAAPELLAMCKASVELSDRNLKAVAGVRTQECQELYEQVVAAIAKAEAA